MEATIEGLGLRVSGFRVGFKVQGLGVQGGYKAVSLKNQAVKNMEVQMQIGAIQGIVRVCGFRIWG